MHRSGLMRFIPQYILWHFSRDRQMGIFTSKKVEWRRKVQAHSKTKAGFDELERLYGRPRAKEFVELIYTKANEQNNKSILEIPKDLKPSSFDVISLLLKGEKDAVLQRRGFYQGYMTDTKNGNLGTQLNSHLRAIGDFYHNPRALGLTGRELAIDQATNWICGDYVAGFPVTRALLEEYIPTTAGMPGKMGYCLGTTADHLWKVHKRLVTGLPSQTRLATKFINKYPSTVGAGFLFDELFTIGAGQQIWPPFGDAHWESIATFFLASIGTIQVFPDGNKRMGRFAYSVVLIKGTHTFKAPTDAFALSLFRMQG